MYRLRIPNNITPQFDGVTPVDCMGNDGESRGESWNYSIGHRDGIDVTETRFGDI